MFLFKIISPACLLLNPLSCVLNQLMIPTNMDIIYFDLAKAFEKFDQGIRHKILVSQ